MNDHRVAGKRMKASFHKDRSCRLCRGTQRVDVAVARMFMEVLTDVQPNERILLTPRGFDWSGEI